MIAAGPGPLLDLLAADRAWDRGEPLPGDAGLMRRLRASRPEAALVLPPSFSSGWFAARTAARQRIGFAHDLRSPLLTRALRRPPRGDLHLSREYLALGATLGAREVPVPTLTVGDEAREAAAALRQGTAAARAPCAVLGPGAVYGAAKRWPAERFAETGRRLAARGMAVLVCGAAAERETCEAVSHAIGDGSVSLAGRTSLGAQAALCAGASLAVCNDSGLAHLAAATGAPTVVVFGSTSSAWSAPLGDRVRVVQRPPVCSPCFQRHCRIGYRCLVGVDVATVEHACLEVAV